MSETLSLGQSRDQDPPIHKDGEKLLQTIKANLNELKELLSKVKGHWAGEDGFYRFYHGSLKVYYLQKYTEKMLNMFQHISKEAGLEVHGLNKQYLAIVSDGTGRVFDLSHNQEWDKNTRPIVEAFFHSREMLQLMVVYGNKLDHAPKMLPSGWAAVLYLFNIR
jgi:hypothetical protein